MENKQCIPRTEGDPFPAGQTSVCVVTHAAAQVKIGFPCRAAHIAVKYVLTAIDHPIGRN